MHASVSEINEQRSVKPAAVSEPTHRVCRYGREIRTQEMLLAVSDM
jgi:hypothetical protein